MKCLEPEVLAAVAAGQVERTHLVECVRCAEIVRSQREIRELASQLAPPVLASARRTELAAETLARAEFAPNRRRVGIAIAAGALAAAAIAVIAWRWPEPARRAEPAPVAIAPAPVPGKVVPPVASKPEVSPAAVPPPPPVAAAHVRPAAATVAARGADFSRDELADRDTVQLHDGAVAIDTRNRGPISVVIGDTSFAVTSGRVELVASGDTVVLARVFAGSVERSHEGTHARIDAGEVWSPPPGATSSLAAFRAGWKALHDRRYTDALAAFDLATDPVAAEDGAYWGAVSAERAKLGDAAARYQRFLVRFPESARAKAAKAAVARLH